MLEIGNLRDLRIVAFIGEETPISLESRLGQERILSQQKQAVLITLPWRIA